MLIYLQVRDLREGIKPEWHVMRNGCVVCGYIRWHGAKFLFAPVCHTYYNDQQLEELSRTLKRVNEQVDLRQPPTID